jgi:cathepsin B
MATNEAINIELSPQDMVACDFDNYGCGGGYLLGSEYYLESRGLPAESCVPYSIGDTTTTPSCTHACTADGESYDLYKCKAGSLKLLTSKEEIKEEIYTSGPIMASFTVYEDFYYYSDGVYIETTSDFIGLHAMKAIGWGTDPDDGEYLMLQN